ncbi:MAG: hypothetical protein M3Z01_05730 [Thermoproteota archaeon]|nr:hypothetical protein [Thermoproteota archaeon]
MSTLICIFRLKLPLSIRLTCKILSAGVCNLNAFLLIIFNSCLNCSFLHQTFPPGFPSILYGFMGFRNSCVATFINSLLILSFFFFLLKIHTLIV